MQFENCKEFCCSSLIGCAEPGCTAKGCGLNTGSVFDISALFDVDVLSAVSLLNKIEKVYKYTQLQKILCWGGGEQGVANLPVHSILRPNLLINIQKLLRIVVGTTMRTIEQPCWFPPHFQSAGNGTVKKRNLI